MVDQAGDETSAEDVAEHARRIIGKVS